VIKYLSGFSGVKTKFVSCFSIILSHEESLIVQLYDLINVSDDLLFSQCIWKFCFENHDFGEISTFAVSGSIINLKLFSITAHKLSFTLRFTTYVQA